MGQRRTFALSFVAAAALGLGVAPAYAAIEQSAVASLHQAGARPECFGVPATIVGAKGERVVGTRGDDVIYANGGHVDGLAGDDLICGYAAGTDGGPGDDRIQAFYQSDRYHGGPGDDTLYGPGGGDQSDWVYLFGDEGRDRLIGGGAGEFMRGGKGADVLRGGPSLDVLKGNEGNDRLNGGPGRDRMNGGDGRDHCVNGTLVGCETGNAA